MTEEFKKQLTPPSTAEVFLLLLTIEHDDWEEPYHIINDIVGHTVDGVFYEPYAFQFVPSATESVDASLELDDIDRRFTASLRPILSPPTVTISLVSDRDMEIIEEGPWEYNLTKIVISGTTVTADLEQDTILDNNLTGHIISSTDFPGFFI